METIARPVSEATNGATVDLPTPIGPMRTMWATGRTYLKAVIQGRVDESLPAIR